MRVFLMRDSELSVTCLPEKIGGRHFVRYKNETGQQATLLTIDAQNDNWVVHLSDKVEILGKADRKTVKLKPETVLQLKLYNGENVFLYSSVDSLGSGTYKYYTVSAGQSVNIGYNPNDDIRLGGNVDGPTICSLSYRGNQYYIHNKIPAAENNYQVCYIDNRRVQNEAVASCGSVFFFYCFQILFGAGFIAINSPGFRVTTSLPVFEPTAFQSISDEEKLVRSQNHDALFSSAPRVYRSEECRDFVIENPPQPEERNGVPWAVMMGPALTMAAGSMFSSVFTIQNLLSTGGNIASAMPSLVMSITMVAGMAVWPTISRKIQRRNQERKNQLAEEDYKNYLKWLYAEIQKTADLQKSVANQNSPTLRTCIDIIANYDPSLWNRSRRHEDFLSVMIGKGELPLNATFKYPERSYSSQISNSAKEMYSIMERKYTVKDVPITVPFASSGIIGVIGPRQSAINFIRALLIELTALHNFEDLHIAFIYDTDEEFTWRFAKWIPHIWDESRSFRYIASNPEEVKSLSDSLRLKLQHSHNDERPKSHFLIIAANKELAERSSLISDLYQDEERSNMTVVTLYDQRHFLPKECHYVIDLEEINAKPVLLDYEDTSGIPLVFDDYISCPDDPLELFIRMSNIRTGVAEQQGKLPTLLTFMEMCNAGSVEHIDIIGNWNNSNPVDSLEAQIGVDSNGYPIGLNIHEKAHGPHGLIAGMTGSGKSEFIISYIASMAIRYSPEDVAFVLIDFKGGGMADVFRDLPHTAGLITNLDGNELKRSFMAIESELQKRQRLFKEISEQKKISNIDIYKYQNLRRKDKSLKQLPHLIIISDEFAELKQQHRDFMEQLIRIARIGRSLGVHLILATQKPDGVVDDQIKSNIHFKVCLKVQDRSDSKAMIDRPDAADITNSGRFYYQVGNDEIFEYGQSPWSGAKYEPSEAPKTNLANDITLIDHQGRVIARVAPDSSPTVAGVPEKQIDAVVSYINETAERNGIRAEKLWLKPIEPPKVRIEAEPADSTEIVPYVLNPIVGVYDDLENQRHLPLVVPITYGGNTILYGAAGTGTLEFINTMLVELMNHHSPQELALHILDYDAGTLSAFETAPHTRSFAANAAQGSGEQVITKLTQELKERKRTLKEYGGEYRNYINNSGKSLPNSLLLIHNFQNLLDSYGDARNAVSLLAREGTQYGMYVFLSGTTSNSIPYAMQPLFHNVYTLQQNNEDQYREILGKTGGIIPQNYRGRGLVRVNGVVCEFQTNLVFQDADNIYNVLQDFSNKLRKKYGTQEPVTEVKQSYRWDAFQALQISANVENLPVALDVKTSKPIFVSIYEQVSTLILYDEEHSQEYFGIMKLIRSTGADIQYFGADTSMMQKTGWIAIPPTKFGDAVEEMWDEMQKRSKEGQEAKLNHQPLPDFEHKIYILDSPSIIMDWLPESIRQHLVIMLCGISLGYHMHFILVDMASQAGTLMGPTYLQRGIPYAQGMIMSSNPSALMLFDSGIQTVTIEKGESKVIKKNSACSGLVLSTTREDM